MDTKKYFSDLLFLSPSFSKDEKREIFKKFSENEETLQKGIEILEDELKQIVNEAISFEEKKIIAAAEWLKNFDNFDKNIEEKHEKMRKILAEQKLLEEAEKENFENILNSI